MDGGEMWSRWDMQDHPPDILITNYSMLDVMLLRETESQIFERTAAWLKEDGRHRFTIIVDELHMYRGTAGTEIAFLLRNAFIRALQPGIENSIRLKGGPTLQERKSQEKKEAEKS